MIITRISKNLEEQILNMLMLVWIGTATLAEQFAIIVNLNMSICFDKAILPLEICSRKEFTTSTETDISRMLVTSLSAVAKFTVNWISTFWM